jgi:hypothetical protein
MGIDPETFRLVSQLINHYATPGPEFNNSDKFLYLLRSLSTTFQD